MMFFFFFFRLISAFVDGFGLWLSIGSQGTVLQSSAASASVASLETRSNLAMRCGREMHRNAMFLETTQSCSNGHQNLESKQDRSYKR